MPLIIITVVALRARLRHLRRGSRAPGSRAAGREAVGAACLVSRDVPQVRPVLPGGRGTCVSLAHRRHTGASEMSRHAFFSTAGGLQGSRCV